MFDGLVTELSTALSVGSLLFFVAVYLVVSIRVFRQGGDELDARARLVLDAPVPQHSTHASAGDDADDASIGSGHVAVRG